MAADLVSLPLPGAARGPRSRSFAARILIDLMKHRQGAIGLAILVVLLALAVGAPLLAMDGPIRQYSGHRLEAPSVQFFFGTDEFSRSLWARILFGLRASMFAGFLSVVLGGVAGSALGLTAGYYGGWLDIVSSRIVDAMLAFPAIVAAIAIVTALGPSLSSVIFAIAVFNVPVFMRLARASALVVRQQDYVLAATSVGASRFRILIAHITQNAIAPLVVQFAFGVSFAILLEAGLSFLGLGIKAPDPSVGGLINASRAFMVQDPWYVIFPSATIALLLTAMNLVADALNDVADPRRRKR